MLKPSGFITLVSAFWQRRVSFSRSVDFLVRQAVQVGRLFVRHDHEMAAGIGVGVEQRVAGAVARDDVIGLVIAGLGDAREEALGERRFGRQDIFDPPRSVQ